MVSDRTDSLEEYIEQPKKQKMPTVKKRLE
jgi:hypothetical protein